MAQIVQTFPGGNCACPPAEYLWPATFGCGDAKDPHYIYRYNRDETQTFELTYTSSDTTVLNTDRGGCRQLYSDNPDYVGWFNIYTDFTVQREDTVHFPCAVSLPDTETEAYYIRDWHTARIYHQVVTTYTCFRSWDVPQCQPGVQPSGVTTESDLTDTTAVLNPAHVTPGTGTNQRNCLHFDLTTSHFTFTYQQKDSQFLNQPGVSGCGAGRLRRTDTQLSNVKYVFVLHYSIYDKIYCSGTGSPPPPPPNPGENPCGGDCPEVGGVPQIQSGKCGVISVQSGTEAMAGDGWTITGDLPGTSANPAGYTVSKISDCQYQICVPCVPRSGKPVLSMQLKVSTGQPCKDSNGNIVYKTLVAPFTVSKTLICPDAPTPDKKGRSLSYKVSASMRHARCYIKNQMPGTPGTVVIGVGSNAFPIDWQDTDTSLTANHVSIAWDKRNIDSPLYLLYELSGNISLAQSKDEGKTFAMTITIGSGTYCSVLIANDGRRFCYMVNNGAIMGKVLDPAGNVWKDTFTAVSGVDDSEISADEFTQEQTKWGVGLLYRSGGSVTFKTSNDGINFA